MTTQQTAVFALCAWHFAVFGAGADQPPDPSTLAAIAVEPQELTLAGPADAWGLLVHGQRSDGSVVDLTHVAAYQSSQPAIARVTSAGWIESVADGEAMISVTLDGLSETVKVRVSGSATPRRHEFENDVIPVLSRFGCNMSGCHGKAEGQNGFKLSIFGSDPRADFIALNQEGRGRRISVAAPARSLLLRKAVGEVPHGGGVRFPVASREYELLRGWIAAGAPYGSQEPPRVVKLEMRPGERSLGMESRQQLRVWADWSDGRRTDVTGIAKYQSNHEGLATVDEAGLVRVGKSPGQVAIMASYLGSVATFRALIPRTEPLPSGAVFPEANFIDRHVNSQLRKLRIVPSEVADDAEFLRRVYLDVLGTLPTAAEARAFLSDQDGGKRRKLVERLVERPEFTEFWSLQWADLLRVDRRELGRKRAYAYYRWIRGAFARNMPLDQLAREILTAEGILDDAPQIHFYSVAGGAGAVASSVSQVFLGVRISCAQCHHHPFDRWSQDDYYGMAAYFQPLTHKSTSRGQVTYVSGSFAARNPRTGRDVPAHPLGAPPPDKPPLADARRELADWLASPTNPWFARNLANRVWARFLGRGLVEPVDDFRQTNPPTNPELMDELARHLGEVRFDLKRFILTITSSQTYQRSSRPNATNGLDEQNFSRALLKRIDAEVLLDAVGQVTGVDERFPGSPDAARAIQLWDSETEHYFLRLFGRPARKTACDCERSREPNVGQVLHLLNSPEIQARLGHAAGRVRALVDAIPSDAALTEELFLTFFARYPTEDESRTVRDVLAKSPSDRHAGAEDVAWSLMNTLEFLFNH